MSLGIPEFTTQLAALQAQFAAGDLTQEALATALRALWEQYDSVLTLADNIQSLLAIKEAILDAYQAGIGLKGTVSAMSALPASAAEGDAWKIDNAADVKDKHLYVRIASAWVDLGFFGGEAGRSGYQVAVANGFTGTETEYGNLPITKAAIAQTAANNANAKADLANTKAGIAQAAADNANDKAAAAQAVVDASATLLAAKDTAVVKAAESSASASVAAGAAASVVGTISRSTPGFKDWRRTWTDQYGRLSAGVRKTGAFFMNRMEALTGTVGALQATSLTTSTTTIGPKTTSIAQLAAYVWAKTDRYGRILIAGLTDGSVRISKLRDAAGALVYPQITAAAAAAASAAASAASALTQIAAVTSVLSRSTPGLANWRRAWTDQYGRLAAGIKKSGAFFATRLEAISATVTSLSAGAIATSSVTIGFASRVLSSSRLFLSVTTDRYGRIMQGGRADGSVQISKLRDGSGALVYPQVAQAKADAATALTTANAALAASGSSAARQALKAALAWGQYPRLMTMAATVTIGANGGATTITGSALTGPSNAAFTYLYGAPEAAGATYPLYLFYNVVSIRYGAVKASNAMGVEWMQPGEEFELLLYGNGGGFRLFIEDRLLQDANFGPLPADGGLYLVRVDKAAGTHRIRWEGRGGFGGVRAVPANAPAGQNRAYPIVTLLGDSGWEGTGKEVEGGGQGVVMGRALGWNVYSAGLGGTGWKNPGASPKVNMADRAGTDLVVANAVMGVIPASINDGSYTIAELRAQGEAMYDLWQATNPGKPLVFMGPWVPKGTPPGNITTWKIDEAARQTAWSLRCPYLETLIPNPITGDGLSWSPSSTSLAGNSDRYSGVAPSDPTHSPQVGHDFRGLVWANPFKRIILTEI